MDKKIAIFTASYNHLDELKNAYDSLLKQEYKNFEWIIVDDNSPNKEIQKYIKKIASENKIAIKYVLKDANNGKGSCFNEAIKIADTEYFLFSLDCDDEMTLDALKRINKVVEQNKDYDAYAFLRNNDSPLNLDKLQNISIKEAFARELTDNRDGIVFLIKTNIIKNYRFPIHKGECFTDEITLFYQLDIKTYWTNIEIEKGEYHADGITKNVLKFVLNCPNTIYDVYKLRTLEHKIPLTQFKSTIHFCRAAIQSRRNPFVCGKYNVMIFLLLPFGLLELIIKKIILWFKG